MRVRLSVFSWLVLIAGLILAVVLQERRFSREASLRDQEQRYRWVQEQLKPEENWLSYGGCIRPTPFYEPGTK
jgi:hypothetical protein